VCKQWHNVKKFIEDMNATYKKGLQIDRINNSKGYSPGNCRWATRTEQSRNKSSNIKLTHNNQTLCLSEWSITTKIPYGTLWERVKILGWTSKRTLTTPPLNASARCELARAKNPKFLKRHKALHGKDLSA
jgi:hypothetical protein